MKKSIAVTAFVIVSAAVTAAQCADLAAYKATYDKALEEIIFTYGIKIADLPDQYGKALDSLLARTRQSGDLEKTLLVTDEIDRHRKEKTVPSNLSDLPELRQLQTAYAQTAGNLAKERAERMVALIGQYDGALERLQKDHVVNNRIEEAQAVKQERDRAAMQDCIIEARNMLAASAEQKPAGPADPDQPNTGATPDDAGNAVDGKSREPADSGESVDHITVIVRARQREWRRTGVEVKAGTSVTLEIRGTAQIGPDALSDSATGGKWLEIKFGTGASRAVDDTTTFTADRSGEIMLRISDSNYSDNKGGYRVKIEGDLKRKPVEDTDEDANDPDAIRRRLIREFKRRRSQ